MYFVQLSLSQGLGIVSSKLHVIWAMIVRWGQLCEPPSMQKTTLRLFPSEIIYYVKFYKTLGIRASTGKYRSIIYIKISTLCLPIPVKGSGVSIFTWLVACVGIAIGRLSYWTVCYRILNDILGMNGSVCKEGAVVGCKVWLFQ